jgi:hypothetical protein
MLTNIVRLAPLGMLLGTPLTATFAPDGPKAWEEADELFAAGERLRGQANKEWSLNGD